MKFLYLPNERNEVDLNSTQVGPRKAFGKFHMEGRIQELEIFSFLHVARVRGVNAAKTELLAVASAFRPTVIFWQHVSDFSVDENYVSELRKRSGCKVLVYHDPDPFDPLIKRVSASMRAILRHSDLALACGLGELSELFRKNGARNVRYLPHCYDNIRFGQEWAPTLERKYKVTMIAGRYNLFRIPVLYMPGGRRRAQFARRLSEVYGSDFALYGKGWGNLNSARGILPFHEQGDAIQRSWVSANWDQFDSIPFYFSDRLPISLAAGVPHVTSYHVGYEQLFAGCPGLYYARTINEAMSLVDWLLSKPKEKLVEEGLKAQEWVRANLEADIIFERALQLSEEALRENERS